MNNYCKIISRLMVSVVCVAAIWSCGDSDSFTIEAKIKDLEHQLAQVEQELKQKDSDTYRKQNATYTQLS